MDFDSDDYYCMADISLTDIFGDLVVGHLLSQELTLKKAFQRQSQISTVSKEMAIPLTTFSCNSVISLALSCTQGRRDRGYDDVLHPAPCILIHKTLVLKVCD